MRDVDPVLTEVLRHELTAVVEEMETAVRKTGRSSMVKVGDFAATVCDRSGRAIGVGRTGMQHTMLYAVAKKIVSEYGDQFAEGDLFMTNDPYGCGSHLPDLVVAAPLFWRGGAVALALVYTHHTDMGGRHPGSQSGQSREIYEEGIRIPLVRLADGGRRQSDLVRLIAANVRTSDDFVGDVDAKIAGTWRAGRGLAALLDKYGLDAYQACCEALDALGERTARHAIAGLADGDYRSSVSLRDSGLGAIDPPLEVVVTLRVRGDEMTVDFTGSSPCAEGAVNLPIENLRGAVFATLRELLGLDVQLNDGVMRPFRVIAPEGSLVNPAYPAAVAGRAPLFFVVEEALHRALAESLPDRVPVPRENWDVVHCTWRDPAGHEMALMDMFAGGWGGRPGSDGPDGVAGGPAVTLAAEIIERDYPVVVERFGLQADTSGAGRHRGSLGVERQYRFLEACRVMVRTNRLDPSMGMLGGRPGTRSASTLISHGEQQELPLQGFVHLQVEPGDTLLHRIGGSGGHGDPFSREPDLVLKDVRDGRLSRAAALDQYGVGIDVQGNIEQEATGAARQRSHVAQPD